MFKIVGIGIDDAEKVSVVYHGELDTFRYTPHDSLIDRDSLGCEFAARRHT
jgi:hypothetical protein